MNEQHESELLQRLARVETKLDFIIHDTSRDRRIEDLEDNQRWLWRAVFGTLIAGVISYFMKM